MTNGPRTITQEPSQAVYEGTVIYYDKEKGRGALWFGKEKLSFTYEAFRDDTVWVKARDKVQFSLATVYGENGRRFRKVLDLVTIQTQVSADGSDVTRSKLFRSEICPHCERWVMPLSRYSECWGVNRIECPKCGGLIRDLNAQRIERKPKLSDVCRFYQVRWLPSPQREMMIGIGAIVLFFVGLDWVR